MKWCNQIFKNVINSLLSYYSFKISKQLIISVLQDNNFFLKKVKTYTKLKPPKGPKLSEGV